MKKLIFSLIALSFMWTACDNAPKQEANATDKPEPVVVALDDFEAQAADLVDKLIKVEGTCMHTCKHGGGKMFLSTGDSAAYSLKVFATEETGKFNAEMEGSDYAVVGVVDEYRLDAAELDRMENEIKAKVEEEHVCDEDKAKDPAQCDGQEAGHSHDGEAHEAEEDDHHAAEAQLAQIAQLRKKLADSGKAYLSFFSVKAQEYKAIDE